MSRVMRHVLALGTALIMLIALVVAPAAAAPGNGSGQGSGDATKGVITADVIYSTEGAVASGSGCSYEMIDGTFDAGSIGQGTWPRTANGVTFHLWRRTCPDGVTYIEFAETTPEEILPRLLGRLKREALPKPTPVFEKLDPVHGWAYVRTPLDFRVGAGAWAPVSVTAAVGPIWATVTAQPARLSFDPGDPAGPGVVSCAGDGPVAPYVPEVPGACSYTFVNASSTSPLDGYHFMTRLTIDWSISWTSSTGAGGPLAPYSTFADAPLAVAEVKGLVTCTGPRPEQGGC